MFQPADEFGEFLFAIADEEPSLIRLTGFRSDQHWRSGVRAEALLFDPRKQVVDPLVETRREAILGGDDIDARDAAQASEQVEVDRIETALIGRLVRDRDDDVFVGALRRR